MGKKRNGISMIDILKVVIENPENSVSFYCYELTKSRVNEVRVRRLINYMIKRGLIQVKRGYKRKIISPTRKAYMYVNRRQKNMN